MGVVQHSWSWPIWPSIRKDPAGLRKHSQAISHIWDVSNIFLFNIKIWIRSCLLFSQVKNVTSLFLTWLQSRQEGKSNTNSSVTQFSPSLFDTSNSSFCKTSLVCLPTMHLPQLNLQGSWYRSSVSARGVCWCSQSFRGTEEADRTCEEDCGDRCGSMRENATRTGSSAASLPPHACSGEVSATGRTPLHLWRTWKDVLMLPVRL